MQMVSEVMSRHPQIVAPGESLQRAAQLMGELDVGALPVCEGSHLVGMVTDRDLAVRGAVSGRPPQEMHVDEVMSADVRWCYEDQPLDELMIAMADSQVRRVPVLSHDGQDRLVGIVALADVALRSPPGGVKQDVSDVAESISRPASSAGTAALPPDQSAGRTGSGGSTGAPGMAGTNLPSGGGQHSMGVAGASGQGPGKGANEGLRTGATGNPRAVFGPNGQEITADRVPPPGLPHQD
jgi:CBS domain-containing protein